MGCSGACCAAFTLTPDLGELEAEGGEKRVLDEDRIADMVIEVSAAEALMRLVVFGGSGDVDLGARYYRCRHWDEGTRLCREYASRPAMCRDYPAYQGESARSSECSHCGAGGCAEERPPAGA